jgi:hypothetical protein
MGVHLTLLGQKIWWKRHRQYGHRMNREVDRQPIENGAAQGKKPGQGGGPGSPGTAVFFYLVR